ncbi:DUF874 family protein [Helicobacter pylori]|uniref:DUF874 family protein n=1 Tax=Helicobacter pylori TaxID=210 RepID=UPI00098208D9|nr:DUF874 family protein [Helicobacter pylori]AQM65167.1 hypothetical protein HPYLSS1_00113 [Helicobacter pylori SS1]AQM71618.1 hypothetical protein HPYLPMSS1_00113 [Helicobacter pylori PMSS1]OWT34562.1 hypothetical protein X567_06675 [Helicobacter pylori PMSS1]UZO85787.1 DUF874 family protein [Helicobacter pylori]VTT94087.1 Helicobacter pylori protein of uncharacterised function (DUF874) [Helicobacter pylori PMSS1]
MPIIRVLVMLATMMMKLGKTAKEKKVFKNVGMSIMGIAFWEAIKESIKKQIKKSDWICGNVKTADDYLKTHPNSWFNSAIGVATITTMLMNVCFADDQSKKEVAETQKEAENARDRANKSGIELEQEKQKTINTQKDFIKYAEQNCQESHGQFFIKKGGIKAGIGIEIEAECKTPKPTKTNQTPIQPKHLPNSKQPRSQRGSKAQELIAYLQKELESLPHSQKAIAKQVDFYKPSSIAYLELDPRDFKVTEEWQKENLKIRSKAQAKMLEMRDLKPDPQAHLSTSQSLLFVQKIFADINKEIKVVANTEKKAEKAGYGYSKRM